MSAYYVETEHKNKETEVTTTMRFTVKAVSIDHAKNKAWLFMSKHYYHELEVVRTRCTLGNADATQYPLVAINNKYNMTGVPFCMVY